MSNELDDFTKAAWATAFDETSNPIYALHGALHAWKRGQRAPDWVEQELGRMALAMLAIAAEYQRGPRDKKAPERALAKVPAAIGLSRSGWNAFVAAAKDNDKTWTALDYGYAGRFEHKENFRAELVGKWNKVSPSQVRKRVKSAKKLGLARD